MAEPVLEIRGLEVTYRRGAERIRAVAGLDLTIGPGEAVALIGESGSGKSVTLRQVLRLDPERTTEVAGSIRVCGEEVGKLDAAGLRRLRGGRVGMVFQEPLLALDPVYTVGQQIVEAIRAHEPVSRAEARARALELLRLVHVPSPERRLDAYPHELSGGLRQRAMIALALSCRPRLLLADEPTTALDATVQIQVLLLLRELQERLGLAILFVTHDIGAAVEIADRIAVIYAGRIVEEGPVRSVIRSPLHPYTRGLLASRTEGALVKGRRIAAIPGSPPDLARPPPGCAFAPRCSLALEACSRQVPKLETPVPGHAVRCLRAREWAASPA
ncbi:MAG: ABC transporter ATP-binding protein [Geminicoccaceae bacterium]|nr:MAG: ABC transporter ATP-binding protein [Geminicoccaceae bacterium]